MFKRILALVMCAVMAFSMVGCGEAIDLIDIFAQKGSRLAVSDAGCGAVLCKAAMQAASLTIFINTKTLNNRSAARAIDEKVWQMLNDYGTLADRIFRQVCAEFGQQGG